MTDGNDTQNGLQGQEKKVIKITKKDESINGVQPFEVLKNEIEDKQKRHEFRVGFNKEGEFVYKPILYQSFTVFNDIDKEFKADDIQNYYDALAFLYENKVVGNIVLTSEFLATIYHIFEGFDAARPVIHIHNPTCEFGKTLFTRNVVKAMHGTDNAIRSAACDTHAAIWITVAATRDSLSVIDDFQFFGNKEKIREFIMQLSSSTRIKIKTDQGNKKLQLNELRNVTLLISSIPSDQVFLKGRETAHLNRIIDINISKIASLDNHINRHMLVDFFKKMDKCSGLFKRDIVRFVQQNRQEILEQSSTIEKEMLENGFSDNLRIISNIAMFTVSQLFLKSFLQEKTTMPLTHAITDAVNGLITSSVKKNIKKKVNNTTTPAYSGNHKSLFELQREMLKEKAL